MYRNHDIDVYEESNFELSTSVCNIEFLHILGSLSSANNQVQAAPMVVI